MWTRVQLKERAKVSFNNNYWRCVLVAFLLALLVGGSSGSGSITSVFHLGSVRSNIQNLNDLDDAGLDNGDFGSDFREMQYEMGPYLAIFFMVFIVAFIIAFIVSLSITCFLINPLEVGMRRFFYRNLTGMTDLGEMGYGFKNHYKNVTITMFFRWLYTFLWSLLFVIPGIVKSYEYRMIPYILAEYPDMPREQVFATSRQMMDGEKWNAFVLDLSFILWDLLSLITAGIVGIFYVGPYKNATFAALYEALKYQNGQPYDMNFFADNSGNSNYYNPNQGYTNGQGGWNNPNQGYQNGQGGWNNPQ